MTAGPMVIGHDDVPLDECGDGLDLRSPPNAVGGSLDRPECVMAVNLLAGICSASASHPGEIRSRMKTIHPLRTDSGR